LRTISRTDAAAGTPRSNVADPGTPGFGSPTRSAWNESSRDGGKGELTGLAPPQGDGAGMAVIARDESLGAASGMALSLSSSHAAQPGAETEVRYVHRLVDLIVQVVCVLPDTGRNNRMS
jgi:hypothetical protein